MSIVLKEPIELEEGRAWRQRLIREYYPGGGQDDFVQVIFNGWADLELEMSVPTCQLLDIDTDRMASWLGTHDADRANDQLHDMNYLCHLSDSQQSQLKQELKVASLSDCLTMTVFLDTGKACPTAQLSQTTKRKVYPHLSLPDASPTRFCWLQLLPIIRAYPRRVLPPLIQEMVITRVRVWVQSCTLITEQAGKESFFMDLVKRRDPDPLSYLYGNQTEYDIQCLLNQCQTFLQKHPTKNPTSYRIRFLQFLVNDPQAGLPYLAQKLTEWREAGGGQRYIWYL